MPKTDYIGIDYSLGKSNVDENGIHYGVIPANEVAEFWYEESEPYYGEDYHCPYCGSKAFEIDDMDEDEQEKIEEFEYDQTAFEIACFSCKKVFSSGDALGDPISSFYKKEGYVAEQGFDDHDIFIMKSPFYTYSQFCSPCAPGAGYLLNWMDKDSGIKTYCLGHDWFEEKETGKWIDCPSCEGTGFKKKSNLTNFNEERFISNGGKIFDDERIYCWRCCHNVEFGMQGKIKEMISKAPYPVYSVETGEQVKGE